VRQRMVVVHASHGPCEVGGGGGGCWVRGVCDSAALWSTHRLGLRARAGLHCYVALGRASSIGNHSFRVIGVLSPTRLAA
jgi:hypothetical protein